MERASILAGNAETIGAEHLYFSHPSHAPLDVAPSRF
jgi:hypothetical protein